MLFVLIAIVLNDLQNCATDLLDVIQLSKKKKHVTDVQFYPKTA